MSISAMFFYALSAAVLVSAVLSVTSRNIFRSAIFLLFSLISIAGIYFWMNYEFIAAVQTIVYVGGIVVLIIFSIFLTQQAGVSLPAPMKGRMIYAALASIAGFVLVVMQLLAHPFKVDNSVVASRDIKDIGHGLLETGANGYVLPFELVSILLLAAMIGCIVIALKPNSTTA